MAFPTPKRTHNYAFDSSVHHRVSKQVMDEKGMIGSVSEVVDMTQPKFVLTPDRSVMSMEALTDSGQPLKRVNTCVLSPSVDFLPDAPPIQHSDNDEE